MKKKESLEKEAATAKNHRDKKMNSLLKKRQRSLSPRR